MLCAQRLGRNVLYACIFLCLLSLEPRTSPRAVTKSSIAERVELNCCSSLNPLVQANPWRNIDKKSTQRIDTRAREGLFPALQAQGALPGRRAVESDRHWARSDVRAWREQPSPRRGLACVLCRCDARRAAWCVRAQGAFDRPVACLGRCTYGSCVHAGPALLAQAQLCVGPRHRGESERATHSLVLLARSSRPHPKINSPAHTNAGEGRNNSLINAEMLGLNR